MTEQINSVGSAHSAYLIVPQFLSLLWVKNANDDVAGPPDHLNNVFEFV